MLKQRILEYRYYILGVLSALLIPLSFAYSNEEENVILCESRNQHEIDRISQELNEAGIGFQLIKNKIQIKRSDLQKARSFLAFLGLPNYHAGFEILDHENYFNIPPSIQEININRALEGEIARSIEKIYGIKEARVFVIQQKKNNLLSKEKNESKASVVLSIMPGHELTETQVNSIQQLVSYAVPELATKNVSVVDEKGNSFNSAKSANNLVIHNKYRQERHMAEKVENILSKLFGPDGVKAQVSIDLNEEEKKEESEIYDSDNKVVRSKEVAMNDEGNKSAETINYEVSKKKQTVVQSSGSINRLSIAVLIDENKKIMNDEETASIKKVVESTVGLKRKRGDTIKIISMPFVKYPEITDKIIKQEQKLLIKEIIYLLVACIAIIALITFFMRRRNSKKEPAPDIFRDLIKDHPNEIAKMVAKWIKNERS